MDFGALSSGTYILALAGLLGGKRVTTHWEYVSAMAETFPDIEVQESIYTVDGRVFTCAGSASSMDLMLDRIHSDYGAELATWVRIRWSIPRRARIPMHSALPWPGAWGCAIPNC